MYFWGKGLNNSLWAGWYENNRSSQSQKLRWTPCETVICGLGHLGRTRSRQKRHMWLWKREFSRSGRGRMRSSHPKQLCFWRSFWTILIIVLCLNTHTWFSGRKMSNPWGVSELYTSENNQSLAANPPTSTTCWKYRRCFGNRYLKNDT